MEVINYSEIENKIQIHWRQEGQKRPYGDSFYICDIIDLDPSSPIPFTTEQLEEYMKDTYSRSKRSKEEYDSLPQSTAKYFNGYYFITKIGNDWRYEERIPYAD